MRRYLAYLILALAALLAGPVSAQRVYAITDVTVVPMDKERLLPGQTVIVKDGRIAAIQRAGKVAIPKGAVRINGRGRYLMPGLAEMHAHVPPGRSDTQWTEDVLFLYAANGVTFARSMLGAPHHIPLRARAKRGELVSPRLYLSGPSINGQSVTSPEAGRKMVAEQKAAGYDFLKIHPGLDRARYDAVAEAAHAHKMPFGGHVPDAVGLGRVLEARQATVDHLDGYVAMLARDGTATQAPGFFGFDLIDQVEERKIPEVVRRTRAAGVWNVPTEALLQHLLLADPDNRLGSRAEMRYVPRKMVESWLAARKDRQSQPGFTSDRARRYLQLRARLIKALHDSGAGLLLGSDAPQWFHVPGFSLHHELRFMVQSGLTPFEALATGTRNVSRFLGAPRDFGTVEVGRRADLLLLDANPLEDVANAQRTAGVMLNGRWLSSDEIQSGLAKIAARHSN